MLQAGFDSAYGFIMVSSLSFCDWNLKENNMNFKEYLEINQKKEDESGEIEVQLILDQKTRNSKIVLF